MLVASDQSTRLWGRKTTKVALLGNMLWASITTMQHFPLGALILGFLLGFVSLIIWVSWRWE